MISLQYDTMIESFACLAEAEYDIEKLRVIHDTFLTALNEELLPPEMIEPLINNARKACKQAIDFGEGGDMNDLRQALQESLEQFEVKLASMLQTDNMKQSTYSSVEKVYLSLNGTMIT